MSADSPTPETGMEEKVRCSTCQAEILATTAARTGGKCMPCAGETAPGGPKQTSPSPEATLKEQVGCCGLLLVGGILYLSLPYLLAIAVACIAHYLFDQPWEKAFAAGVCTFIAYKVIEFALGMLDVFGDLHEWISKVRRRRDEKNLPK